jgi:hypothetical protein
MPWDIFFELKNLKLSKYHMSIIQVLSWYHLKLLNDFKKGGIMAVVRPKPPQILVVPPYASNQNMILNFYFTRLCSKVYHRSHRTFSNRWFKILLTVESVPPPDSQPVWIPWPRGMNDSFSEGIILHIQLKVYTKVSFPKFN